LELRLAAGRAEIVLVSVVAKEVLRAGAIDLHAADRIGCVEVCRRIGRESVAAALAAEMEAPAFMFQGGLARARIDGHPADGIPYDLRRFLPLRGLSVMKTACHGRELQ